MPITGDQSAFQIFYPTEGPALSGITNVGQTFSVIDPARLRDQCIDAGYPLEPWYGKCNSVTLPLGPEPGIAYFLVAYDPLIRDYEAGVKSFLQYGQGAINYFATVSFIIADLVGNTRSCFSWVMDNWKCVTPGIAKDPASVYMITLRDCRAFASCGNSATLSWFNEHPNVSSSIDGVTNVGGYTGLAFNIPRTKIHQAGFGSANKSWFVNTSVSQGTGGGSNLNFYDTTAGNTPAYFAQTPWTWGQMLTALSANRVFGKLVTTTVTLPYTPTSTPCDWDLQGVGLYMATMAILDRLGMAMKLNIFDGGTGGGSGGNEDAAGYPSGKVIEIGKDDGKLTTALDKLKDYKIWDYDPVTLGNYNSNVLVRRKVIPQDLPSNVTATSTTATWAQPYVGYVYYNFFNGTGNQRLEILDTFSILGGQALVGAGGYRKKVIDHDVPKWWQDFTHQVGPFTIANDFDWVKENVKKYIQSLLSGREINRVYGGFHTADDLLPGPMLKIIKWESTGAGPRTHFYAGDNYLPSRSIYNMVNPHRYVRHDDFERFRSIEMLDLAKL